MYWNKLSDMAMGHFDNDEFPMKECDKIVAEKLSPYMRFDKMPL